MQKSMKLKEQWPRSKLGMGPSQVHTLISHVNIIQQTIIFMSQTLHRYSGCTRNLLPWLMGMLNEQLKGE